MILETQIKLCTEFVSAKARARRKTLGQQLLKKQAKKSRVFARIREVQLTVQRFFAFNEDWSALRC